LYLLLAICASMLALCSVGAPLMAQAVRDLHWNWTGVVRAGQTVTLDLVRAQVRIVPAGGNVVGISALLQGRRDAPESVTMVVDTSNNGFAVTSRYGVARVPPFAPRQECLPQSSVHGDFWYNDVGAELILEVPQGVRVAVHLLWGDIAAVVSNPMQLETQNGSVRRQPP
jgi:hypothetical protein